MSRLGDYRFVNHVAMWLMHRGLPAHKGTAPILEKALEEQLAASSDDSLKEGLHLALRVIRGEDHQSNTTANQKKLEYAKKHLPLDFFVTPFLAKHWNEIPRSDKELTKVRAQEDALVSVPDAVEFQAMLFQLKTSVAKMEEDLARNQAKLEQVLEVPQLTAQVQELTKVVSEAKFAANEASQANERVISEANERVISEAIERIVTEAKERIVSEAKEWIVSEAKMEISQFKETIGEITNLEFVVADQGAALGQLEATIHKQVKELTKVSNRVQELATEIQGDLRLMAVGGHRRDEVLQLAQPPRLPPFASVNPPRKPSFYEPPFTLSLADCITPVQDLTETRALMKRPFT